MSTHAEFLRDVAGVTPPARLPALLAWFAGGAAPIADPRDRRGVHPLVVPITRDGADVVGFLRWPTPDAGAPLPIVRTTRDGLRLVARSADQLLHRELAVRDATPGESPGALLDAANAPGRLYEVGDVARSGLPLKAFLLLKVGVTHEFFEELIEMHLERGDTQAALVTADRACRDADGWGRPLAFRAALYERLGMHEMVAEAAQMALLEPTWTLGGPFAPTARRAGWRDPIDGSPYRRRAADPEKPALDRAAWLMDATHVDGGDWDAVRGELAGLYREGGLEPVARLVGG